MTLPRRGHHHAGVAYRDPRLDGVTLGVRITNFLYSYLALERL